MSAVDPSAKLHLKKTRIFVSLISNFVSKAKTFSHAPKIAKVLAPHFVLESKQQTSR
jgi:hypothetical protein